MSEIAQPDERHLSAESFERCLRSRVPMEHPIKGEPPVTLFIDPDRGEIGIRVPATNDDQTGRHRPRERTRTCHAETQTGDSWR